MTDARKKWDEHVKLENDMLQKHIINKMIRTYHQKHFHFFVRQSGKPRFRITKEVKLQGEAILHYVKFVYWSLLQFNLNKNHQLQIAHDFTMKTMRECLKPHMVKTVVGGMKQRTLGAMQTLGIEDERLNVHPKKPDKLMQLQYQRADFEKNGLDIASDHFDEKKGYADVIHQMELKYKNEVDYIIPHELESITLKMVIEHERTIRLFLYSYDEVKIAKWLYWSLMANIYNESFLCERSGNNYPSLDSAHLCHVRVMNNIEKLFGDSFASKIFYGGSFFGKNDTVTVMKKIGVMDTRKYPGLFGLRLCLFAKLLHVTPIILPSEKEWKEMRGDVKINEGRRFWHP